MLCGYVVMVSPRTFHGDFEKGNAKLTTRILMELEPIVAKL